MNTERQWDNLRREIPEWFRDAKFGLFFIGDHTVCRHIRMNGIQEICMPRKIQSINIM